MTSTRSYSSTDSSYLDVEQGDSNEVIDTGIHEVGDMESRNIITTAGLLVASAILQVEGCGAHGCETLLSHTVDTSFDGILAVGAQW